MIERFKKRHMDVKTLYSSSPAFVMRHWFRQAEQLRASEANVDSPIQAWNFNRLCNFQASNYCAPKVQNICFGDKIDALAGIVEGEEESLTEGRCAGVTADLKGDWS